MVLYEEYSNPGLPCYLLICRWSTREARDDAYAGLPPIPQHPPQLEGMLHGPFPPQTELPHFCGFRFSWLNCIYIDLCICHQRPSSCPQPLLTLRASLSHTASAGSSTEITQPLLTPRKLLRHLSALSNRSAWLSTAVSMMDHSSGRISKWAARIPKPLEMWQNVGPPEILLSRVKC